ncbi:MAG: enoyl-CoA hydratase-related protein, partial [Hyphomicrobium sp.]
MQSDRVLTPPQSKPAAAGLRDLTIARPEAGLAVVTLNRPKARNALSLGLIEDLAAAFAALGADDTVAAVVLAAEGGVFSAGHDLKELTAHRADPDGGHAFFTATMTRCADMMQAIVACPKPVIAAVGGMATAAGCQLVATCDLAIAGEHAAFATPGVNIGLFCSTPMVALSRNLPRKKAMEMLLLGEAMTAHQAAEFGLVNRVVAGNQVLAEAMAMARAIAAKSKMTVATGKAA